MHLCILKLIFQQRDVQKISVKSNDCQLKICLNKQGHTVYFTVYIGLKLFTNQETNGHIKKN